MVAAEVTYNNYISTADPSVEVFDITTATNGDWLYSRRFTNPVCLDIQLVGSVAAADAFSVASVSGNKVVFNLVNTTNGELIVTLMQRR